MPASPSVESRVALLEAFVAQLLAPAPAAAPPITIGPFPNVPAPGSPIRSDWPQQLTQYTVDEVTTRTALIRAQPTGTAGKDFVDLSPVNGANTGTYRMLRADALQVYPPGSPAGWGFVAAGSLVATGGNPGVLFGHAENGEAAGRLNTTPTGSGDPKYFVELGLTGTVHGQLRMPNITSINPGVPPWPVGSAESGKANVADYTDDAVAVIEALRPVTYERLTTPGVTRVGFIADEMAATLPEAVVVDELGGPGGYLNDVVTAVLVAAVQVLAERVAELEAAA